MRFLCSCHVRKWHTEDLHRTLRSLRPRHCMPYSPSMQDVAGHFHQGQGSLLAKAHASSLAKWRAVYHFYTRQTWGTASTRLRSARQAGQPSSSSSCRVSKIRHRRHSRRRSQNEARSWSPCRTVDMPSSPGSPIEGYMHARSVLRCRGFPLQLQGSQILRPRNTTYSPANRRSPH